MEALLRQLDNDALLWRQYQGKQTRGNPLEAVLRQPDKRHSEAILRQPYNEAFL